MVWLIAVVLPGCSDTVAISPEGTFVVAVGSEQYHVRIDNPLMATKARRMMTGAEPHQIVAGEVARGNGGFNTGYSWHIKPGTVSFADQAIEVCDGRPSDIEGDIDYWVDNVKRYCPWGARFVSEVGR